MKIIQVLETLEVGGAEVLVADMCFLQRNSGHDVRVVAMFRSGPIAARLTSSGVPFEVLSAGAPAHAVYSLYRAFRRLRPDAVHFHNAAATIYGALPARLLGIRNIVSTRHGLVAPPYGLSREIKFSLAARLCRVVTAVCEGARRNLAAAPLADPKRLMTVYNGARPACTSTEEAASRRPGLFVVVTVARLTRVKDQATLLHAVSLARSEVPEVSLWIVGDGPMRDHLQTLSDQLGMGDAVTFFGEQAGVGSFLQSADLFVLSSISEGIPVALLEAMAASLPCVVTNVGGMPEVLSPADENAIVPPGDPEALGRKIVEYARDETRRQQASRAVRLRYQQRFTLERMAERYLELYGLP